jgi:uncharacterized membrane protein
MAENEARSPDEDEGLQGKSTRDKLFRAAWIYLRGCVVILVLLLFVKAAEGAYTRVAEWLEPLSDWTESSAPSGALIVAILILGPWTVGMVAELLLTGRLFQKQRGVRAYQRMEQRLSTELKADQHHGYRVALVDWPNPATRSIGLVVADFSEPDTGRELAAVYLPGTPDPTKGAMRVVAAEDLTMTDWDLSDLTRFHVTFGTAAPDLADDAK